jgi:hypothetical protein
MTKSDRSGLFSQGPQDQYQLNGDEKVSSKTAKISPEKGNFDQLDGSRGLI